MINLAANLTLHTATSATDALDMQVSLASALFESKSFDNWRKAREAEAKTQSAVVDRLNGVIRAIGVLAKITAGR
jgi:hypothetical protein